MTASPDGSTRTMSNWGACASFCAEGSASFCVEDGRTDEAGAGTSAGSAIARSAEALGFVGAGFGATGDAADCCGALATTAGFEAAGASATGAAAEEPLDGTGAAAC